MSQKFYMRSNGNGGLEVSKFAISVISVTILVLSSVVNVAMTAATIGERISNVEKEVERNAVVVDQVQVNAQTTAVLLGEIRRDIKYIKEQVDENHGDIKVLASNQGRCETCQI